MAEVDGSGTAIRSYHWGLDLSGTMGAGGVAGLLFTRHHGAGGPKTYYALYDGNGNVTGLADPATGTAAARYEYGPFGEPMRATGPVAATNPVGFSTKYTDEETGLVYYGYRYYSPEVGKWLRQDPYSDSGSKNLYVFCENRPLGRIDRTGLKYDEILHIEGVPGIRHEYGATPGMKRSTRGGGYTPTLYEEGK
ncbi:MAG: RHS repeat-associated core domain-containing protein [Verrucomicrobia bacterium]|nr:RHS repeat-associated core domain-containing protein [Verrucomicrobiota bacterium]